MDSDSLAEWTSLRFFGKRLNLTHFRPRPQGSSHNPVVDAIVIGDSYADDVDMGYRCWPSLLASRRGWSILNASRGGSRTGHGCMQHARALAFAKQHNLRVEHAHTTCVVHLGGNNLLHTLWLGPLAVLMLYIDLLAVSIMDKGKLPRCSFFGVLGRMLAADLSALIEQLSNSHRRIVVAGLPVCHAVPTARILLGLLLCPLWLLCGREAHAHTVRRVAVDVSRLVQQMLLEALMRTAEQTGTELVFFDEAGCLQSLADEIAHQMPPHTRCMFKDTHHPSPWVHERLANRASELIDAKPKAQ